MKRNVLLLLVALGLTLAAHAQFGAYATFTVDDVGGISSSPLASAGTAYRSTIAASGGTFGAFYDFHNVGPVRLGADVRATHNTSTRGGLADATGAGTHLYSFLGGARASFKTPLKFLNPYAEGAAGLGRTDFGLLRANNGLPQLVNNVEYHVFAGVDIPFAPYFSFRAVELGYGGIEGSGHNYSIKSISTGIVFRFPSAN